MKRRISLNGYKTIRIYFKNCRGKQYNKSCRQTFYHPICFEPTAAKTGERAWNTAFCSFKSNWRLTEAGQIYVENAKKMIRIKKDTYSRINDMIDIKKGKLVIGLTPERGTEMFTALYPAFYKKYPYIKIVPIEMTVRQQQIEIAHGNLDIGFLTLQDSQKSNDEYIHICSEEIILGVPKAHPLAHLGGKLDEKLPKISLTHFEKDSFAIMQKGSTLREIYDNLIIEEGLVPRILLETRSCQTYI